MVYRKLREKKRPYPRLSLRQAYFSDDGLSCLLGGVGQHKAELESKQAVRCGVSDVYFFSFALNIHNFVLSFIYDNI